MKVAFIFPGQGSQAVGMGKDLYEKSLVARRIFEEVDEALHEKLSQLIFSGDDASLTATQNAQPAIMAVSMAAVRALENELGQNITGLCVCVAGHSLGEYTALCAAGALNLADTARLLRARGQAMAESSRNYAGSMAAILGLSLEQAQEIADKASSETELCIIANDNCPGQLVLSGHDGAISRAMELALQAGAKRAVKLSVSGAFHSPLMTSASSKMGRILENIPLMTPQVPIVSNITATLEQNPLRIKELLVQQVTGSVRWRESVETMARQNIDTFIECGHGKVLAGLIKRILPDSKLISAGDDASVKEAAKLFC